MHYTVLYLVDKMAGTGNTKLPPFHVVKVLKKTFNYYIHILRMISILRLLNQLSIQTERNIHIDRVYRNRNRV